MWEWGIQYFFEYGKMKKYEKVENLMFQKQVHTHVEIHSFQIK